MPKRINSADAMETAEATWLATPASMARYLTSLHCSVCQHGGDPADHVCWMWPNHLDVLSMYAANVISGHIPRLIVHAPPRHGKSDLISKWTPTYFLEWFPNKNVILCSYEAKIAGRWGRRVRNGIVTYQDDLSVRIASDSAAANDWKTTEDGGMKTAGVGGPITGEGADLLIVDDPYKNWEQAASATYRDVVWDWWVTTALTRLEPRAGVILDHTRWHVDDLAGRILDNPDDKEDWVVLSMPAIAEENDQLGRKPGEPLWPERYTLENLEAVQSRSSYTWDALYQQRPPDLTGKRVYGQYTARNKNEDLTLNDALPLQLSIDFNIDPGMHGVLGQHDRDADFLIARHVLHAKDMDVRTMMDEMVKLLKARYRRFRWPILEVFGDASGRSRWAGTGQTLWQVVKEKLDDFNRQGFKIPYRFKLRANNPGVADRVETVNAALCDVVGKIHYQCHPDCKPLIADFEQLKWDNGEIAKKDRNRSHPSDAEGYRVHRERPIRKLHQNVGQVGTASASIVPYAAMAGVKTTLYRR